MEQSCRDTRIETALCRFSVEALEECGFSSSEVKDFVKESYSYEDKQALLNKLAGFMLEWKKAINISKHFSRILEEVLSRTKNLIEKRNTKIGHLHFSETLSHLLRFRPHLISFVVDYFEKFGSFFICDDESRLILSIETSLHLLKYASGTFSKLWDWSLLCDNVTVKNYEVSRKLSEILSIVLKMDNVDVGLGQLRDIEEPRCDKIQSQRVVEILFTEEDLCGEYIILGSTLLSKSKNGSSVTPEMVHVPSLATDIDALCMALLSEKAILLEGPIGSGKTCLVEYLCSITGRSKSPYHAKVQLGDQTDSKALIGSYCCGEVPGEFIWKPGILTRAVTNGHWLLLEDIDNAPMDVTSVLIPLLESRVLSIPGKGNVQAATQFKLFATRRSHRNSKGYSTNSSLLDHLWSIVHIESLKKDELVTIIDTKFPRLQSISKKLVDIFSMLSSDLNLVAETDTKWSAIARVKRLSTVRDFMKWCTRVDKLESGESLNSQDVFLEALDCFCAMLPKSDDRRLVALAIGAKLNLGEKKVEYLCNKYKPVLNTSQMRLKVGRVNLLRKTNDKPGNAVNFAFTRHSLTLLESISVCVAQNEPTLLVGETGTGKTSAVQYLAWLCGRRLTVINMSQQSDSTDLIGGFKPVETKQLMAPFRDEFEKLFCATFSRKQNIAFLTHIQQCFATGKWEMLFKLMLHTQKTALEKLTKGNNNDSALLGEWKAVGQRLQQLRAQLKQAESSLAFSFVEGALVKAIKSGDWVLLDEINLAASETLECLNCVLESDAGSVTLLERGDAEPVIRHGDFRVFACMNPANDVGKKDLPAGIRNRFTEIFVGELQDESDLKTLVMEYLKQLSPNAALINGIVSFYQEMRKMAEEQLTDGSGNRPYYSLRTLCRGLKHVASNPYGNILRSVYEGFCISFLTQLDRSSHNIVQSKLQEKLLGHVNSGALINQPLPKPATKGERNTVNFEGYWIHCGDIEPYRPPEYVFTLSVKQNLRDLARVVSGRYFPVLIQGETSVGKTSLINWLAKASGNHCVRINNHEHTDIQEYLGCYTSDANGKLVFKEGVLVDAMRKGYWIILDELNLAPTDVLEALNRLLDDNRELFIPEIQETVRAHQKFMLFATQNPPGHYAGRKVLSRAFRNRFVELHFEELPSTELEMILHKRCSLPKSYAKKLVNVMLELQSRRRGSGVFAGKHGFITLRDLFRWADRYSKTTTQQETFFDWDQQIAEDGYCLLAGRCRNSQEASVVQEVIEKHLKRKVNLDHLFGIPGESELSESSQRILKEVHTGCPDGFNHVVFTYNMRRLAVLVARALEFNEPVLLVGETGCGKTTICQIFAALRSQRLYSVNCHMHSETSDFLGGLRPVRQKNAGQGEEHVVKLFEWCDGPLVRAMKEGAMFLSDEISLADDSVLERLNSVLEPERTLVLAEKGNDDDVIEHNIDVICAKDGFHLVATMNPGGDYGKKELSPALRNRFTEIWCPATEASYDIINIIEHNLDKRIKGTGIGKAMVDFVEWFKKFSFGKRFTVSIRDYLSWVRFINVCSGQEFSSAGRKLEPEISYVHGAFLVFLDALGLGSSTTSDHAGVSRSRNTCLEFLYSQVKCDIPADDLFPKAKEDMMDTNDEDCDHFTICGFSIPRGSESVPCQQYALDAPTTAENAARILRAMQLRRPILLEGSPGVGKTSLVSALAKASGHNLVRINLSEQTDISDLFGADLPTDSEHNCRFAWCDGPLLQALKAGDWVVLDELNLASQAVLEGLNACFDHRGEVFIPELGMTFQVQHEKTRFFACQNPLSQGGGRKGLPKSFLNRFTQVYVEPLTNEDLKFICENLYGDINKDVLHQMILFNSEIHEDFVIGNASSGRQSNCWEFNLRDIFRWCDLMKRYQSAGHWDPVPFVRLVYVDRMRTQQDRDRIGNLCSTIFGKNYLKRDSPIIHATPHQIQVGCCIFPKSKQVFIDDLCPTEPRYLLHRSLKPLESLLTCLQMNWMAILIGPKSCGKTSLAKMAAELACTRLDVMAMNSATDTTELLGGYEQVDLNRPWNKSKDDFKNELLCITRQLVQSNQFIDVLDDIKQLLHFRFKVDQEDRSKRVFGDESGPQSLLDAVARLTQIIENVVVICRKHKLCTSKSEMVKSELMDLQVRLRSSNGNAHVSGQFEWVDGELVRALKYGYWLLVDNVNFCSPSVLDRLNGLLEPDGVLTMNERGVVDGKIPVIVPHPDFRLILTMDPKHGEISRAMRNRGVEIFLLNQDADEISNQHDIRAILQASGCVNNSAVSALESIHKITKDLGEGCVTKLAHAGSLLTKLMDRGADCESSLHKAIYHVYGAFDNTVNNDFRRNHSETPSTLVWLPRTTFFQNNSTFALIHHQLAPIMIMRDDEAVGERELRISVDLFLEWASEHDWKFRLQWLHDIFASSKHIHMLREAAMSLTSNETVDKVFLGNLRREIENLDIGHPLRLEHQPLNLQVNGPLYSRILRKAKDDEEIVQHLVNLTSRLFFQRYHLQFSAALESSNNKVTKRNSLCPLKVAIDISNGLLKVGDSPDSAIPHIYPFCRSFNDLLSKLSKIIKTDEDFFKVWTSLKYYQRFIGICQRCYPRNQQESTHAIALYWKLFKNETYTTVFEIYKNNYKQNFPHDVLSEVHCLDEVYLSQSELAKVTWLLMKEFGQPSTFLSEKVVSLWITVNQLFNDSLDENRMLQPLLGLSSTEARHRYQVILLDLIYQLMMAREDTTLTTLRNIEEVVKKVQNAITGVEIMDGGQPQNVADMLSDISLSDDENVEIVEKNPFWTELHKCDAVQCLTTLLAENSFTGCLFSLRHTILTNKYCQRGGTMKIVNEKLKSYHDFCMSCVRRLPMDTALIRYFLHRNKNGHSPADSASILSLTDCCSVMFSEYTHRNSMHQRTRRQTMADVHSSLFQLLWFPAESDNSFNQTGNPSPQLQLVDINKRQVQFEHVSKFLWINVERIQSMTRQSSIGEWELLLVNTVRVFLSTTPLLKPNEVHSLEKLLVTILDMSGDMSLDRFWSDMHDIVHCFLANYELLTLTNDVHILRDCFEKLLRSLRKSYSQAPDREALEELSTNIELGVSCIHLGFIHTILFRPAGKLDPVEEKNVEIQHAKDELADVETELHVRQKTDHLLYGVTVDSNCLVDKDFTVVTQTNPKHVGNLLRYRRLLRGRLSEIGDKELYRPSPTKFPTIVDMVRRFPKDSGHYFKLCDLISNLRKLIGREFSDEEHCLKTRQLIGDLKTWAGEVEGQLNVSKMFPEYEDLLGAYVAGLVQVLHGLKTVVTISERLLKRKQFELKKQRLGCNDACTVNEILRNMLPLSKNWIAVDTRCQNLLGKNVADGIEVICAAEKNNIYQATVPNVVSSVRKHALRLLKQCTESRGYAKPEDLKVLKQAADSYLELWLRNEEERKANEQKSTSLYKIQEFNLDKSEEEKDKEEIAAFFTNFDDDFNTESSSLSENQSEANEKSDGNDSKVTDGDIQRLCEVHNCVVTTVPNVSGILNTLQKHTLLADCSIKETEVMVDGYNLATMFVGLSDNTEISNETFSSHLFMSSLLARSLTGLEGGSNQTSYGTLFGNKGRSYDIYHDCNVKEVVQVLPVLSKLASRLEEFLQEWTDHPILIQLKKIIHRIQTFPITSPVMKILNGLEILLFQAQDWETNASRHVSIKENLNEITQLIIQWRKLELSYWSTLLDVCEQKSRDKAGKWWLHVYHSVEHCNCAADKEDVENAKEFLNVLKAFMEASTLGQFQARLQILSTFYYQTIIDGENKKDLITTILYNIHSYYVQFEGVAKNLISEARKPIEKELKDFIKIAKWKDINYWAMKQAATKSHYTLHKLMKKYQVALSESCSKLFASSTNQVSSLKICEDPGAKPNYMAYVAPISLKDTMREGTVETIQCKSSSLETTARKIFVKMRKLAKDALSAANHEKLSNSLSDFTGDVINSAKYLQKLELGDKVGKKRTELRKHIQVQKRRGLADLFTALKKLGLSYRKGVRLIQQGFVKDAMMVEGEDISVLMTNTDDLLNNTERPINSTLLNMLQHCKEYYQKNIKRFTQLENCLPSPSKELNPGDISRIKGYSEELRHITQTQRERITLVGKHFCHMRVVYVQLSDLLLSRQTTDVDFAPPQVEVARWTVILDDVLNTAIEESKAILMLLDACPDTDINFSFTPVPEQSLSELSKSCKQSGSYVEAGNNLNIVLDKLLKLKSTIQKQVLTLYSMTNKENQWLFLANWEHYKTLTLSFQELVTLSKTLNEVINLDTRESGIGKMSLRLKEQIEMKYNEFTAWNKETFIGKQQRQTVCQPDVLPDIASLKENILLSFQGWVKRREKLSGIAMSKSEENADVELTDNLLRSLNDNLTEDTESLNISERTNELHSLTSKFTNVIDDYYVNKRELQTLSPYYEQMRELLPILCQYIQLVEYYLFQLVLCHRNTCKLHSVLLAIFVELVQKGFCLPPDEQEAEGEGATSFEDKENCGIGEGEGQKDVSDQIEDEEQLTGAHQEGKQDSEDETKEDDFVKEEEHGIEMSDDFEAKACDLSEDEDDNEESGDENKDQDELEEQMGENEGESQLDERLWGDSDNEDEKEGDDEQQRGEGANAESEQDLVAKEENKGASQKSERKENKVDEESGEDNINELDKNEENQGNLNDEPRDTNNENDLDDSAKPEDEQFPEDIDIGGESDEETGKNEGGEDDDENMEENTDNIENKQSDEIEEEPTEDQNESEEPGQENVDNMTDDPNDDEKNQDEDFSQDNWKTSSDTKGDGAEAMEESGDTDQTAIEASTCSEDPVQEESQDGEGTTVAQQDHGNDGDRTMSAKNVPVSDDKKSYRKQLNKSRADRTLGSSDERVNKRPKVVDADDDTNTETTEPENVSSSLVEHLKSDSESHDTQVYDTATQEQQRKQRFDRVCEDTEEDEEQVNKDEDWELPRDEPTDEEENKSDSKPLFRNSLSQNSDEEQERKVEEETTLSSVHDDRKLERAEEIQSRMVIGDLTSDSSDEISSFDYEKCRAELEEQLGKWRQLRDGTAEEQKIAQDAWHKYEMLTCSHAQELCEQLRIVMEPSIANKLKGDYRTGKRLNMRKVIPYIASQFRKDKIWLRRTKKSKRQYQILLAVDDSSSMADNHSKQLAFESVAVITNAMTRLEAGEIAICSFGDEVKLLHPFHETFSDQSGANILQRFTFEQTKTKIAQLVDSCTKIMLTARSRVQQGSGARINMSQLLLIVSDGRGIFLEGVQTVQNVVRRAKEAGIFLVFVILDNPTNKDSVLDIKVPVFRQGSLPELKSYIEQFPFPFYIILRDIGSLPQTLSDSLRQWFELVTNMNE